MNIELNAGDTVEITFKDTDGKFIVAYGDQALTIESDLPDSDGRVGVIYSERYEKMSVADLEMEANQGGPAPGYQPQADYGYGTPEKPMSNEKRLELELDLVRLIIKDAIDDGHVISIYDGEDYPIEDSTDLEAIMAEVRATDMDSILFKKTIKPNEFLLGSITLIYGNAPWEVVNDYTPHGQRILMMSYEAEAHAMQEAWS